MSEWQRLRPADHQALAGRVLSPKAATLARRLSEAGSLDIAELREGLAITTRSYVGRLRLDDLVLVVRPKLAPAILLSLFRYAYGLRKLDLHRPLVEVGAGEILHELLIAQLHAEARELLERGTMRRYVEKDAWLSSPRGRINVPALARAGGLWQAALPCRHHPRSSDHVLHQVLAGGLRMAAESTTHPKLRVAVHRLAEAYAAMSQSVPLNEARLQEAIRSLNRLTSHYEPSLRLITLLYRAQALELEGEPDGLQLPGFLFDMNRFFQALVARLLTENLADHHVEEERTLHDTIRFLPDRNPRNRRPPRPRPDFLIHGRTGLVAILDAKYRDLWTRSLPREMLYQLGIYALSQPRGSTAAIVYPTEDPTAREATLAIQEPAGGSPQAYVALRPLCLPELARAVGASSSERLRSMARTLLYGAHSRPSAH